MRQYAMNPSFPPQSPSFIGFTFDPYTFCSMSACMYETGGHPGCSEYYMPKQRGCLAIQSSILPCSQVQLGALVGIMS